MNRYLFNISLRILAFLLPFYIIYHGPLHDNKEDPEMQTLWKYILSGFCAHVTLGSIIILF